MSALWSFIFGWFPTVGMRVAIAGLIAIAVVFMIMRIVKVVLDTLPFL